MYEALWEYKITHISERYYTVGEILQIVDREQLRKHGVQVIFCVFPHRDRDRIAHHILKKYPDVIFGYPQTFGERWDGRFRQAILSGNDINWVYWSP